MQKTCYEKLVEAIIANPNRRFEISEFSEFELRGHSKKEFCQWVKAVKWILEVVKAEGNINGKKAFCRQYVHEELEDVPFYRLTEDEISLVLKAEAIARGKSNGVIFDYVDRFGKKDVSVYPANLIPANEGGRKDIICVFSGHPGSGSEAALAIYRYIYNNGKLPEGVMFLGLEDNQNLTEFSPQFKLRKSHEYRMYMRQLMLLGLPARWLTKLLMTPHDTSTSENSRLIYDTCKKYGVDNANLICVTYPAYQLRVACQVSFDLVNNVPGDMNNLWLRIADLETKPFLTTKESLEYALENFYTEKDAYLYTQMSARIFSYDNPEWQLADLVVANCLAHLYRKHNVERFLIPGFEEGKYPEELKPLLPLFLGYSYANVANELCGTDETVANVLKVVRTLMLDEYDKGVRGYAQDNQMVANTEVVAEQLLWEGLTSMELMQKGQLMSEEKFLEKVRLVQKG